MQATEITHLEKKLESRAHGRFWA